MVALGIRNELDMTSNMGRETHLMPVVWEEAWDNWVEVEKGRWEPVIIKWPVVAPNTGKVERNTSIPFLEKKQKKLIVNKTNKNDIKKVLGKPLEIH